MRVERKVLTGAVGWSSEYCFGDAASVGDEEALAPVGFYAGSEILKISTRRGLDDLAVREIFFSCDSVIPSMPGPNLVIPLF